jgi:SHS2 domain-containing protein
VTRAPGFEFVDDVTSDLSFVAKGTSLSEVFCAAAEALLDATLEERETLGEQVLRRVVLVEPDLELLLLRFLNELVYLRDADGLLLRPREVVVQSTPTGAHLTAEFVGESIDPARHRLASEVKAATAHGLSLTRESEDFRVTVTLDV